MPVHWGATLALFGICAGENKGMRTGQVSAGDQAISSVVEIQQLLHDEQTYLSRQTSAEARAACIPGAGHNGSGGQ